MCLKGQCLAAARRLTGDNLLGWGNFDCRRWLCWGQRYMEALQVVGSRRKHYKGQKH